MRRRKARYVIALTGLRRGKGKRFGYDKRLLVELPMLSENSAAALRHWIKFYHQHLKDGLDAELAAEYLRAISADEAALKELENKAGRRS